MIVVDVRQRLFSEYASSVALECRSIDRVRREAEASLAQARVGCGHGDAERASRSAHDRCCARCVTRVLPVLTESRSRSRSCRRRTAWSSRRTSSGALPMLNTLMSTGSLVVAGVDDAEVYGSVREHQNVGRRDARRHRTQRRSGRVDRRHVVGVRRHIQVAERVQAETGRRSHACVVNRRRIVRAQARTLTRRLKRDADNPAALRDVHRAGRIDRKSGHRRRQAARDRGLSAPGVHLDQVRAVRHEHVAGIVDRNCRGLGEAASPRCRRPPSRRSADCRYAPRVRCWRRQRRRCPRHRRRAAHSRRGPSPRWSVRQGSACRRPRGFR